MKTVSLLPSLITTGNLFCGTYAILQAINGNVYLSSWLILIAMFFDLLDGQVARLKNVVTKFGVEYDSLSDLVSFGFAPAIIVYTVTLKDMGRIGPVLFFIYIACTALRLARFNSQKPSTQKADFSGLPSPAASGFVASVFILNHKFACPVLIKFMPIVLFILAMLMVSTLRYPATGMYNLWKKKTFFNLVAVILCGTMLFLQLELFLFLCFLGYALFGVVGWKMRLAADTGRGVIERSGNNEVA